MTVVSPVIKWVCITLLSADALYTEYVERKNSRNIKIEFQNRCLKFTDAISGPHSGEYEEAVL
jgi:hypothetical protein